MEDFPRCHRLELPRARKSCSPADSPVWRAPNMRTGKPVFAQVTSFLPMHALRCCSDRYDGNRRVRRFSCHGQFRSRAFAQLTAIEPARQGRQAPAHWLPQHPVSRQAVQKRTLRPDLITHRGCVEVPAALGHPRTGLKLREPPSPGYDGQASRQRTYFATEGQFRTPMRVRHGLWLHVSTGSAHTPARPLWRIRTSCGGSCRSIGQLRSRQSGSGPMNLDATGTRRSRLTTWPFRR